tara:strand:+ start:7996 stop:8472 length:477 start_codon:yes stop_codon:yes gene_type:complete
MIRKLAYLIFALTLATCSHSSYDHYSNFQPTVEDVLKPYYSKLDSIYKEEGIVIDYTKISTIQIIDSLPYHPYHIGKRYEGLYNNKTRAIYIETFQLEAFHFNVYEEKIMLVLAHEIGHSQGIGHSEDPCSIMFWNSKYVMELLQQNSITDLVTQIYN